jgi:hypothetical protein
MNLSEQLAGFRASWRERVPTGSQALMDQHVAHLAGTGIERRAKQVGDRAPQVRLRDQHGNDFDVVYAFTDDVRKVYEGFSLDIFAKNGRPDDWSLPCLPPT